MVYRHYFCFTGAYLNFKVNSATSQHSPRACITPEADFTTGMFLKCPLRTNKARLSIGKARIQQRTLHMPNVEQEHISLESYTLRAAGICLGSLMRPGGEWLPNYNVALICSFAYERLSKTSDGIHAIHPQPQSPNMEFPGLRPRA